MLEITLGLHVPWLGASMDYSHVMGEHFLEKM